MGPTASGKSRLALDIADALGGPGRVEIIGADAMALYRGMDIGTAKVLPAERRGIAHRQVDVLDISQAASVAAYQREARADFEAIVAAGKVPLVVGGSGLYLRALLDVLEFPGTDPRVRRRREDQLAAMGPAAMHAELLHLDPLAARRIGPHNGRRLVRALEVIDLTGRPYSATLPAHEHWRPTVQIGLRGEMGLLDQRIALRTRQMFDSGFLEEVEALDARGLRRSKTAIRATGYEEALAVLDGTLSVEEGIAAVTQASKRLARKQMKWFKRDPRTHWLDFASPTTTADAIRLLEGAFSRG